MTKRGLYALCNSPPRGAAWMAEDESVKGAEMNSDFPDLETVSSALALAGRAPSVHNSQPWQWRVGDQSVHLYANPDLLLPQTDPDARDLTLSCEATFNDFRTLSMTCKQSSRTFAPPSST